MKVFKYLPIAAGVAGFLLMGSVAAFSGASGVRAAAPAPSCDLQLNKTASNSRPLLGSTVTFTLRVSVKCNVGVVVTVADTLPPELAQVPPGEQLRWQFSAPAEQLVTKVFTVGASPPGADACNARITNNVSAAAQLPGGEGAIAFTTASATLTTACTPALPATGEHS